MTYQLTNSFPREERFDLTSQRRRAAVSIAGRGTDKDFARFLRMESRSNGELVYQFVLAGDLGYIGYDNIEQPKAAYREVRQLLAGLLNKLATDS